MIFRGGEFSTGEMGNFQPALTLELLARRSHGKSPQIDQQSSVWREKVRAHRRGDAPFVLGVMGFWPHAKSGIIAVKLGECPNPNAVGLTPLRE
jgi:hypothetical protein